MKPKVYLETTIPSYLTAWPSRDVVIYGHQQSTKEWWETRREKFDLYVSDAVLLEAACGDSIAAAERLKILRGVPILEAGLEVERLARELLLRVPLPPRAVLDATHIAIAVVNGIDFLLTWNCRHIANATLRPRIDSVCHSLGYSSTVISTPLELMGGEDHEG